ncbi:hypothetical protein BJV78DRAFT_1282702 [Lactifluus subvellereus]|nr:hypothetical protein BJV78DRAFT_1282702 [Lactifluus subvellereus]
MPSRGLRNITSASLGSFMHLVLASSLFVLTTTARPDGADFFSPHWHPTAAEDAYPALPIPVPVRDAVVVRRGRAFALVVRRRSLAGRHVSAQALAAIVLCSLVAFCALLGCLRRLPASCSALRSCCCYFGSSSSSSSSSSSIGTSGDAARDTPTTLERFDAELGIRPVPLARGLSPPPPYSRAPSYESPGRTGRVSE